MNKEILASINKKFGSDLRLIKRFPSGIANENYLLENSSKQKVVARILVDQPLENLPLELDLQKHILSKGIKTPLLLCEEGEPIIVKSEGKSLTLTKFIESDNFTKVTDELIKETGRILARLQSALSSFDTSRIPPNYLSPEYQSKLKFKNETLIVKPEVKEVLDNLRKSLDKLELPKTIIHADLNKGNYLVKKSKIVAILDLETVEVNYRILDLAAVIHHRIVAEDCVNKKTVNLLLSGFEEVEKLTDLEKETLSLATQYSAACFSYWCLATQPYTENSLEDFYELQREIKASFEK